MTSPTPGPRAQAAKETREERIYFRATPSERDLLQQAADATGKSLTAFVLEAASREAERALIDRRLFIVDAERWAQFTAALDHPAADKPRLRRLLQRPVDVE
ncbi:MAG: hypothetical protein AMXMBFR23_16280 [Chloroflexota bacterium]